MPDTPKITDEKVRALAMGIVTGTIFTDRHCRDAFEVRTVFMTLAFLNEEQLKEMKERDIGMIYEHIDKAGPRSINGKPAFFSLQTLTIPDTKRVLEEVKKLQEYQKSGEGGF